MRPPVIALAVFITALSGGMAVPQTAATDTAAPAANSGLPAITVTTVGARKLQDHILASGLIGPVEEVSVQPLIEGQPIENLAADVGDIVAAGTVLATLSSATLALQKSQIMASAASADAGIAQAEASLVDTQSAAAEAKRSADRTATLMAQGSATTAADDQSQAALVSANARVSVALQTLAAAKAQKTVSVAQIDNIDLQLSRTRIVTPVAGIISSRNAKLGAIASAAGQPMFTVIRDGALELRADVAESDIARLAKDQSASLTLASGTAVVSGTVRLVEPTLDTTTRLGHARIALAPNDAVRSGMFAEADVLIAERDTVAVPVSAVGSTGAETTVMLVKDGVVHRVVVTTGIRDGGWVEILTGLAKGDSVVAKAGAFVADGDKINPVAAPAETN